MGTRVTRACLRLTLPFDGMKMDKLGNMYITGPGGINGGIWELTPDGKRLGFSELPKQAHNLNWGGSEERAFTSRQ